MAYYVVEESPFSHFFVASTKSAPFWFLVRLYVGWEWLSAGWEKFQNPAWFGSSAGAALNGFVQGALGKTGGAHPDVQSWYAAFLQSTVLPHLVVWSNAVAIGEFLVGLGLIFGVLTGIAAFFGLFMNLNYLLAGTVSLNPILFTLSVGLVLAWRVAGYYGGDRYVLPLLHRSLRPRGLPRLKKL
ncbi:MAG TPA: DoxX family membrane protein [Candidatus Paceibacterota bacterium]|nr:DoxX family membrane protein [Candidatus Paceibacterota bacterium]